MEYTYCLRKGEVGDRERWLAWAAMVTHARRSWDGTV